jgi:hypothetical protein
LEHKCKFAAPIPIALTAAASVQMAAAKFKHGLVWRPGTADA